MKKNIQNEFNSIDLAVVEQLASDGRQSISSLGKCLSLSRATVKRSLDKMIEKDLIRVVALSNPASRGHHTMITMGMNVRLGQVDAVAENFAAFENVRFVIMSGGRYDIIVWMEFHNPGELHDFISDHLGQMPDILSYETMVTLKIVKAASHPQPDSHDGIAKTKQGNN